MSSLLALQEGFIIISVANRKWEECVAMHAIAVSRTTKIASFHVGGQTLHSWARIGGHCENLEEMCGEIQRDPKKRQCWLDVKVLLIDGISMLSASLFDKLAQTAQHI
ncbi:hypothetical protein DACRYDRAFT_16626 [Dacryopinax primogenitus]|uniref:ATP-dependent DNA helicase n=1 Tax=Dacryopinax primogenitus (strain DJM 731) TaxID=1858805 RepID=M5G9Y1_DACPD|nr:uncharacterized protein DACRYDRAFT_16626 [Dacryopinax primogenitus]EJU00653.1 hypothetical protein DACRYDRAFT_16626 [Dacryopinax primogenitus]